MKKWNLLLFALLVSLSLIGQMRVALVGGVHTASVTETNSLPTWSTEKKPFYTNRTGVNLGFLAEVPLSASGNWYFQPGMLYMAKGRKFSRNFDEATAQVTDTLLSKNSFFTNYVDLPLNLAYKIPLGKKTKFLLSAGPYIGFLFNGKNIDETRFYSTNKFEKNETTLEVGNAVNKVNTFDFGLNARAGFDFGSASLTGFYSQGFSDFYTASYDGSFKHKVMGVSLGIWLNRAVAPKPRDKDKDGVPDDQDACPSVPGTVATQGCPDKDGDGIADATDKCPDQPGLAKYQGCPIPDTDKDGIDDEKDQCPTVPGLAKYNGCPIPDTDKDGINDEMDACPDKAGVAEYKGCPIPDSDGDGLNDKEDQCPNEPGTKENNGCPVIRKEVIEKVNFAAKNIFFDQNSDKILPQSFASLNDVVKILQENPTLHMHISGHTDNVGKPAYNLTLSQKRADAVMKYFTKKGIAPARLLAKGYGQEQPIGDNSTVEGKAQNRRVELKLEEQ